MDNEPSARREPGVASFLGPACSRATPVAATPVTAQDNTAPSVTAAQTTLARWCNEIERRFSRSDAGGARGRERALAGVGSCVVTVTAESSANYNQARATFTVTVQEPLLTTPGKPRAPQISSGNGSVIVQWLAPSFDGGTPILRYEYCLLPMYQCNNQWVEIPDSAPDRANHGRYGTGDLTLAVDAAGTKPRRTWKTETGMWMAASGARGVLLAAPDTGGLELAVRGDVRLVGMRSEASTGADGAGPLTATESETSRLRFMLEGSRGIALVGGRTLTPTLEVALRHDGGDAETGTGIDVGAGVSYADPELGLTVEGTARGLLAHEDTDYREWGASGSVRIDPGAAGRGLALSLSPAWGADLGGAERLWSARDARGLAATDTFEPAGRSRGGSPATDSGHSAGTG